MGKNFMILVIKAIAITALFSSTAISAQEKIEKEITYTNAKAFPIYGQAFVPSDTSRYQRLPMSYKNKCRQPLWYLGTESAGLYVRFRSNSTAIYAKWSSMYKNSMNHMTDTGTRGLDLYALVDGKWQFVSSGRPGKKKETSAMIVGNMKPEMREYMLYLSLYDGIDSLEIGVASGSTLDQPEISSPSTEKPIIMYGTSILQGGCSSRPGMAFTNIIGRKLDKEVVNLGFSGNALLDYEIAELMADIPDPGIYILDYVPNASVDEINRKGEKFFRILRDAHPKVPIIFLEDPIYPHSFFDLAIKSELDKKNAAQENLFQKLKASGEKRIYFLKSTNEIGNDNEATVDGIHFTDLGMFRYSQFIMPAIKKALKTNK